MRARDPASILVCPWPLAPSMTVLALGHLDKPLLKVVSSVDAKCKGICVAVWTLGQKGMHSFTRCFKQLLLLHV